MTSSQKNITSINTLDEGHSLRITRAIEQKYTKVANHYNRLNWIVSVLFGLYHLRRKAIKALNLKQGDTVVDLCCGTGVNFTLLKRHIGVSGNIIGVDLTGAMLEEAKLRISRQHLTEITLIKSALQDYIVPESANAVLITFGITIIPDYDRVIKEIAARLKCGQRMVILEMKRPNIVPDWILKFFHKILAPFGFYQEQVHYTPWKSMQKYFSHLRMKPYRLGSTYIAVGWNE